MIYPQLDKLKDSLKPWIYSITHPWVFLTSPLTSTSWDGDSYSTTAKTLIDMSAVFGVPAGVQAVLVFVGIKDSGSSANDVYLVLSPNNTAGSGAVIRAEGLPNDSDTNQMIIVPCNSDGDLYYQIAASGAGTMDIFIQVWGYQR
jgi:hypothetical protein